MVLMWRGGWGQVSAEYWTLEEELNKRLFARYKADLRDFSGGSA